MSKIKKQKKETPSKKNRSRPTVASLRFSGAPTPVASAIPTRATVATIFTLFLMFLAWIVGYVWGFAAGQFSYVNNTVAYKSSRHAALQKTTSVPAVHERTAQVKEVGDDYFVLYFPDTQETAKAITTAKTAYHIPAPRAAVPSSYAMPSAVALEREDIHVGEMVTVTSQMNIRRAVQFVVTSMSKAKDS